LRVVSLGGEPPPFPRNGGGVGEEGEEGVGMEIGVD
jgi:hypothetical protein